MFVGAGTADITVLLVVVPGVRFPEMRSLQSKYASAA